MQPLRVGGSRPDCGWELTVERKGLWVSPQAPPLLPRGPEQILRCLRLPCRPRRSDRPRSHAPSPCSVALRDGRAGTAPRGPAGTPGSERGQRPGASHPVRWPLPPGETPGLWQSLPARRLRSPRRRRACRGLLGVGEQPRAGPRRRAGVARLSSPPPTVTTHRLQFKRWGGL